MRTLRMPEIGFGVRAEEFAGVGDERGDVEENWL